MSRRAARRATRQCAGPIRDAVVEHRLDELLARMTLAEKVGQLTLFATDRGQTGPTIRERYANDIRSGGCGALFNSDPVAFTRELQRRTVELESQLGLIETRTTQLRAMVNLYRALGGGWRDADDYVDPEGTGHSDGPVPEVAR